MSDSPTASAADVPAARHARSWRLLLSLIAVGVVTLTLGMPRMMAGIDSGPHDDTLRDVALGRPVPAALLKRAAEGREAALAWVPSGRLLSDLATLRLNAVIGTGLFSPERRRLVADAVALQTEGLRLSPADAYGWTRLLQGLAAAATPVNEIERILNAALARGPNEPSLILVQIQVGMLYWGGLSEPTRARLGDRMILAAQWRPSDLVRIARTRLMEADVVKRLSGNPLALARYTYARDRIPVSAR